MPENKSISGVGRLMLFTILILMSVAVCSQSMRIEDGLPFIRNYLPGEYKAHNQNFSVIDDNRGVMYFGNFAGILEFDGSDWQLIQANNKTRITALNKDSRGRLLVGSYGEFGLLSPDSAGYMTFMKLDANYNGKPCNFNEVLHILVSDESSWFVTENILFKFDDSTITAILPESDILSAYSAGSKIFCLLKEEGLCEFVNNSFIPLAGCELLSETVDLKFIEAIDEQNYLLATSNMGLYRYNGNELLPFNTPVNAYLKKHIVSCGVSISDDGFAFGTEHGGVVILSLDGTCRQILTEDLGLNSNYVRHLYWKNGGLWAALNNGLARIETPSPLVFYNLHLGLYGGVTDILRHKGFLYVATYTGLFFQDRNTGRFTQIPGLTTGCWSLTSSNDELLIASSAGVYVLSENSIEKLTNHFALSVQSSEMDPSVVFVGHNAGMTILEKEKEGWNTIKELADLKLEITDICQDKEAIWLSSTSNGLFRYFPENELLEHFDTTSGLPSNMMNKLNRLSNGIVITTTKGLYRFDKDRSLFSPYELPGTDSVFNRDWHNRIFEDNSGNLWTYDGDETHIQRYQLIERAFVNNSVSLSQVVNSVIWCVYGDPDGLIWLGGPDGLIRYTSSDELEVEVETNSIIREVRTTGDSLLFAGNYIGEKNRSGLLQNEFQKPVLNYEDNQIRFRFTAGSYHFNEELKYELQLKGYEDQWSEWTTSNSKEYSNLAPGNYTFMLRAKNVFNQQSTIATYEFTILKPWYWKWWAYLLYVLVAGFLIAVIAIWRSRNLVKEKERLENIVKERTAEVVVQKEEIEKQSRELAGKNNELERINVIVKAINSEINFTKLLQSILEKTKIIKGVDKATALVYDDPSNSYKFKASFGWDLSYIKDIEFGPDDIEKRYLHNMEEVYEDIFISNKIKSRLKNEVLDLLDKPKCMLIIAVKVDNRVEGYLILENMKNENAFTEHDFSFIKNLKEHYISAFIKTKILEDLQHTLTNLKETQEELIRQEKLASVGQLTKGIVDRVINPLNYINNFSNITSDMVEEIVEIVEEDKGKLSVSTYTELEEITNLISGNLDKIMRHGESAARIVKGMETLLQDKSNVYVETEFNSLVEKKLELALKDLKAEYKSLKVNIHRQFDEHAGKVSVMHEEFEQVIKSLVLNAFYILNDKFKSNNNAELEIRFSTLRKKDKVEVHIRDNGSGIPSSVIEKIYDPFFTTKPTAEGTGLGLYMCKDVIETHGGALRVMSKEGEYSEFIIILPSVIEK
jgi:signal transduction histidine kinase/ligand-binding sensor domain-containing protein